jgi:hypothetical protein
MRLIADPGTEAVRLLQRLPWGSFELRSDLDLFPRPHYAYCILQAATLASRLGLPAISVAELGVAGGRGLAEMEVMAALASERSGVRIDVYGFDRATGLPAPADHRDIPYHWRTGFFEMDVDALRRRLRSAELVLGDLADTVPEFTKRLDVAPMGFVAVDVDFYTSTVDGFRLFDADDAFVLPRVLLYLDDIVGEDYVLHNDYVGELAAVRLFNETHARRKIAKVNGLVHKRIRKAAWCDSIFAFHSFDHPSYDTYVGPPTADRERPI